MKPEDFPRPVSEHSAGHEPLHTDTRSLQHVESTAGPTLTEAPAQAAPSSQQTPEEPGTFTRSIMVQDPKRQRKMILALMVPLFMALVAVSVVNVAMTPISRSLNADTSQVQWVVSGYALAFAVFLVSAGRLGDATGRRRVFITGIVLFTLGSLGSGLAPSADFLIAARLLQGFGSGLLNPQTTGIIQQQFSGQARAKAYGMFGTTVAIATMVGPLLGGVLIRTFGEAVGWRMMFLINVPIGIIAIIFARLWLPNDRRTAENTPHGVRSKTDLDPVGSLLMTVAIFAIMWPFVERSAGAINWVALPIGLLLLWGFIIWENRYKSRGREPMLNMSLFSEEAFRNGILIVGLYFLGSTSVWLIVPVYMQSHLGETALVAALISLPASLLSGILAPIAGRYVLRAGRRIIMGGIALMMVGLATSVVVMWNVESGALPVWAAAVSLSLVGAAGGLTISPNQTLTMKSVSPRISGVAGGVMSLGQRIGTAVGTALIPGIMFSLTDAGKGWNIAFAASFAAIFVLMVFGLIFTIKDRRRELREQAA